MNIFSFLWQFYFTSASLIQSTKFSSHSVFESEMKVSFGDYLKFDSKGIKDDFQKYLLKPIDDYLIFFPSAIWVSEISQYLVISRISAHGSSALYASYFNENWEQITSKQKKRPNINVKIPGILPIPVPDTEIILSGPEDPKIFERNQEICIIFNMLHADGKRKVGMFSLKTRKLDTFVLKEYSNGGFPIIPLAEKNWAPIVINSQIYFLTNFYGFQIIKCKTHSECEHVSGKYDWRLGKLKPGSIFMRFEDTDYYFSFSFNHFYCPNDKGDPLRLYRPVLTVIHAKNEIFSLVYQSHSLMLFDFLAYEPYTSIKLIDDFENTHICNRQQIVIISSIIAHNSLKDATSLLGFINDKSPFVATITGLGKLITSIIEEREGKYYNLVLR